MSYRKYKAIFRFYAELNDFLPKPKKQKPFEYAFSGKPGVKDAIEALGVPHTAVDLILVNGKSVSFDYPIEHDDRIAVYPEFELLNISEVTHLRPKALRETKFIVDVNLGKLARNLRLIGLDTLYDNTFSDREIVSIARAQKRIILTRDVGLLKHKDVNHGYWVRVTSPANQIIEVINKFDLISAIDPFSICLECNGKIDPVKKEDIADDLLPRTRDLFDEFYQCQNCGKIYWKGSHYEKMLKTITRLKKSISRDIE